MAETGVKKICRVHYCTSVMILCCSVLIVCCGDYDYFAPMESLTGVVEYDTTRADERLRVASVALRCDSSMEKNIAAMRQFIEQIVTECPKVDLIVFGEMSLGWYEWPKNQRAYQWALAQTIPGPATDTISSLADRYSVYITFGMNRLYNGKLYNAQPVIGPDGTILAIHHKTLLTPADKDAGFTAGTELATCRIRGVKTGVVICKDQENSLLTKAVVRENCRLVLLSFADDIVEDLFGGAGDLSRKYNAWLVTSNRYGREGDVFYRGEIRVSDPGGNHHIRKADGSQYLYYNIPIH